ncbi:hypothetical protein FA13DRAFT_1830218 [Coprinellus micaceus]|uniref:Uncharacterized protein n=1 Tax=Coprinellus micaceus TaxID=71717 RepID=A0A4Y7SIU1_COPMI|nr:hypothetical protein FA13DRAFT_1830218 [Coprinellus micaceus]
MQAPIICPLMISAPMHGMGHSLIETTPITQESTVPNLVNEAAGMASLEDNGLKCSQKGSAANDTDDTSLPATRVILLRANRYRIKILEPLHSLRHLFLSCDSQKPPAGVQNDVVWFDSPHAVPAMIEVGSHLEAFIGGTKYDIQVVEDLGEVFQIPRKPVCFTVVSSSDEEVSENARSLRGDWWSGTSDTEAGNTDNSDSEDSAESAEMSSARSTPGTSGQTLARSLNLSKEDLGYDIGKFLEGLPSPEGS